MKTIYKISKLILLFLGFVILILTTSGCNEQEPTIIEAKLSVNKIQGLTASIEFDIPSRNVETLGLCWSTKEVPTVNDSLYIVLSNHGVVKNSSNAGVVGLKNLTPNTTYYVRAYATNRNGTAYSSTVISFTTLKLATVGTIIATSVTFSTAISGGNVTDDGGSTITSRGVCWSTTPNPIYTNNKTNDGSGVGWFSSSITELSVGTTYYVRAYATNIAGTAYGNTVSFVSKKYATIKTANPTNITLSSAISGGNITDDGGSTITSRGVCWSTTPNPIYTNNKTNDGSGVGSFSSSITGLNSATLYYVRAYACNENGIMYGDECQINTLNETVIDIDGNVYKTIRIGNQIWMAENLKATKYRNGDPIANVTDNTAWSNLKTGAWCDKNNDVANGTKNGKLYNWYAVADNRKIAPVGWRVPSYSEMSTLNQYFQGNYQNFGVLKVGLRSYNGTFGDETNNDFWWTSSAYDTYNAYYWDVTYNNGANYMLVFRQDKRFGFPVRCVKG